MENLDFILSLFNQYCFNDAKNNIESLEYYTSVNPALSGNTLISSLLGAIKNYTFDSIDLPKSGAGKAASDTEKKKPAPGVGYNGNKTSFSVSEDFDLFSDDD